MDIGDLQTLRDDAAARRQEAIDAALAEADAAYQADLAAIDRVAKLTSMRSVIPVSDKPPSSPAKPDEEPRLHNGRAKSLPAEWPGVRQAVYEFVTGQHKPFDIQDTVTGVASRYEISELSFKRVSVASELSRLKSDGKIRVVSGGGRANPSKYLPAGVERGNADAVEHPAKEEAI